MYAIDAEGGPPQRLTSDPDAETLPRYSRDGRWIYFVSRPSGRPEVWKMPAAGGAPVQVTTTGSTAPLESADGKILFYLKPEGQEFWLHQVPVNGGTDQRIAKFGLLGGFAVSARGLYYIAHDHPDQRAKIHFLDLATGADRTVVALRQLQRWTGLGLSVSPDQRWFLCSWSEVDSDLILVENFR